MLRLCQYPVPYQTSHLFIYSCQYELILAHFIQWDAIFYTRYLF